MIHEESEGGPAAQTGNLVHDAAEWFHKHASKTQEERVAAGLAALEAARAEFPDGDPAKARQIFGAYAADPINQRAEVKWIEEQVTLRLKACPTDPTGKDIVIVGTLDQVRRVDGEWSVWDIKTGDYKNGPDNVLDYLTQQAIYTLAARATLDPTIGIGGLIYTPAYFKARSQVFLPNSLTIQDAEDLLLTLPFTVSMIRRGLPVFRPNVDNCKWCELKKRGRGWPKCKQQFHGVFGQ